MRSRSRERVYVGPVEIAGQYGGIVEALATQGVHCDLHLRFDHPFGYPTERVDRGWIMMAHRGIIALRSSRELPHFPHRILLEAARRVLWTLHAVAAVVRYRTFVFAFAMTFAPEGRDLPLLRLLGKRIIVVTANGSEARPPYVDDAHRDFASSDIARAVSKKRRTLARIERWAQVVIGAPLSSSPFLTRPFVNYFAMGMPCRPISPPPASVVKDHADHDDLVRILHAPSNPRAKGTERIREVIQSLIEDGLPIEYSEMIGEPNTVVIERLARTDVVVDQLYCDTPMATLAAEAAAQGKPTVVGGYGWDLLRPYVPEGMWPPSQLCSADTVRDAIAQLVTDPRYREQLGEEAKKFVTTQWSLDAVGERWRMVLEGTYPEDWLVDPLTVIYTNGSLLSDTDARARVRSLINECGVEALGLSHNPRLENAFVVFATSPELDPSPSGTGLD